MKIFPEKRLDKDARSKSVDASVTRSGLMINGKGKQNTNGQGLLNL